MVMETVFKPCVHANAAICGLFEKTVQTRMHLKNVTNHSCHERVLCLCPKFETAYVVVKTHIVINSISYCLFYHTVLCGFCLRVAFILLSGVGKYFVHVQAVRKQT